MPDSLIRAALESDLAAIAGIYASYIPDTAITFDTSEPTLETWAATWRSGMREEHPWFVSELEGEVIGYAKAGSFRTRGAYRQTVETAIYLSREHLSEGHGRGLYERLLEEVAERSFHTAIAGITLPNKRSVGLHESLGFKPVGILREVGFKLDSWWDVGWWQWSLKSLD